MAQEHQLRTGDVVALVSGSPRMTVEYVEELPDGVRVHTVWSVFETNEIRRDAFPAIVLKRGT